MAPGMVTPASPGASAAAPPPAKGGGGAAALAEMSARVERARDMLAESRLYAALSEAGSRLRTAWHYSKQAGWVVGTSALVLVLPVLWEIDREHATNMAAPPDAQPPSSAPSK